MCGGVKAVAERWRRDDWAEMRSGTAEKGKASDFRGVELPLHPGKRESK